MRLDYAQNMKIEEFYQQLPSFSKFSQLTEDAHYRKVPSQWSVIITDVKSSTQAIEAGKYKEVNRLGAAAIVCANQAISDTEIPYVFGGDGASFLVDAIHLENVLTELGSLKRLAKKNMGYTFV